MGERIRSTIVDFVERAFLVLDEIDYYRILGLARDAAPDAVQAAYYKLAARLHPDIHGADVDPEFKQKLTSVFSRVVEAYRVLSVADQRAAYDRGLGAGELRAAGGAKVRTKPEQRIDNPGARRFYSMGMRALDAGDKKSASMHLRMALSLEDNPVIHEALARAGAPQEKS
jgi:curved DNA-binding protein CbpA